jgi:septal ring factor EnvC (AmiA/AmiB activator)
MRDELQRATPVLAGEVVDQRWELSTSARLRETQASLAASQADLTRVERERDELEAEVARLKARVVVLREERDEARVDLRLWRHSESAELASARAELELWRRRAGEAS